MVHFTHMILSKVRDHNFTCGSDCEGVKAGWTCVNEVEDAIHGGVWLFPSLSLAGA